MKTFLLTSAAMLLGLSLPARAEAATVSLANPYVELGFGQVFESDVDVDSTPVKLQSDPNAFLAAGFSNFLGPVDLRLDFSTTDRDYDVGFFANLQTESVMVDALYTAPVGDRVSLYGGGGFGGVRVEFGGAPLFLGGVSGSDTVFGWEAMGGARVRLFSGLSAFAEARYQGANDADIDGHNFQYNSTAIMGGLRWTFGGSN